MLLLFWSRAGLWNSDIPRSFHKKKPLEMAMISFKPLMYYGFSGIGACKSVWLLASCPQISNHMICMAYYSHIQGFGEAEVTR